MDEYFSTFASGLSGVVKPALKDKVKDAEIKLSLDGLVVYTSNLEINKIKEIRFFNNSFVLLYLFQNLNNDPLKAMMKAVLHNPGPAGKIKKYTAKNCSFRIVTSLENQLVSVDNNLLIDLEELFSEATGMNIDRTNPDYEIWFLWRREGSGFVGLRITKTPNYEKILHKGELRPELANMMCLMAELKTTDVVLDPFAGYGAIPIECARNFSVKQIMAGEKDAMIFKILQDKISKVNQKITLGKLDALKLNSLTDKSVDKIITDPPWGFYDNMKTDWDSFYQNILKEFIRVLKPGGLMVILMGQKELFEKVLMSFSNLQLAEKYNILVSGKKADIYKIKKLS